MTGALKNRQQPLPVSRGRDLLRIAVLFAGAALMAGLASTFGIAHDYGYLRASLLAGVPDGNYHAVANRLAARAAREHGSLVVIPTAGSLDNVERLVRGRAGCSTQFAFAQDGTPVPANSGLEVLGRLPDPESLLLLGRRDRNFADFADFHNASIGIGPEGSGTGFLIQQLFEDPDLKALDVRLSNHSFIEQAVLVAQGSLDLAGFVMDEDAPLLRTILLQHDLEIVSPKNLGGLLTRHPWLGLGQIPAGRFDLVRPIPAAERIVAHVDTLVLASPCARRAERVVLLMLLAAELPGFVRANPPVSKGSATALPLAAEARQFFLSGEPELADRYFPWLVNLMSPAYWVYLLMAVTVLFNAMKGYSRFRLWRIDATRDKLETSLERLLGPKSTRPALEAATLSPQLRQAARQLLLQFENLRARCQRQVASIVTPMGDELFYRYQEALIAESAAHLSEILGGSDPPPHLG